MPITPLTARAHAAPWNRGIEVLIQAGGAVGSLQLTQPAPAEDVCVVEPTFSLTHEAAQTLMDDLWHAGLRPTEGTGSAGALAATQAHLKDMQRLVFKDFPEGK